MADVIVVGARCAGAPTAMLLARRGYHVLLLDRARFPSDIPHGHFIHGHGPRRLAEWGLLGRVARHAPPVTSMTLDLGDFPLTGTDLSADGVAMGYAPRRAPLDHALVSAAVEAGVELREGFTVEEVTTDLDRVTGVRGRIRNSAGRITERACFTVGADGRNSRIARAVRASTEATTPPLTCWFFTYWSGVDASGLEVYARRDRMLFGFPTGDGLFGLFIAWPAAELHAVRRDIEAHYMAAVDRVPALAERIRNAQRTERFSGASDVPNFIRKPVGPGWALVGDAGCHKDPYLALGIRDAFRDADFLAHALDEGLSGRRSFQDALAVYERRRNEAMLAEYQRNIAMARFTPPPPEALRLRAALRGDDDGARRYFLALQGLLPWDSFFSAENVERILSGTAATA